MKKLPVFMLSTLLMLGVAGAHSAKAESTFNKEQRTAIQKIIHNYLVTNPEVLIEASKALEERQQAHVLQRAKVAIQENSKVIFSDKQPMEGNPKGDVTLVEFFDYQCVYCKKVWPSIKNLISNDDQLRVILIDFPIFGEVSTYAAKAALAAKKQGKYLAFHQGLMNSHAKLTKEEIVTVARQQGLDIEKMKKEMQSSDVIEQLKTNRELGMALELIGTPAFVVAKTAYSEQKNDSTKLIPGAASEATLRKAIQDLRN